MIVLIRNCEGYIIISLILLSNSFNYLYSQELVTDFHMPKAITNAAVTDLLVQPDNKVLLTGDIDFYENDKVGTIIRLNEDGSSDKNFTFNHRINFIKMDLLNSGEIIAVSRDSLYKISPNGQVLLVISIGEGGNYPSIATKGESIYLVKDGLKKYNANLEFDENFNQYNVFQPYNLTTIAFQGDHILVGGSFSTVNGNTANDIARFDLNGTLDLTFNTGTGTDNYIPGLVVQPDGKILIDGLTYISYFDGQRFFGLVRLNTDGSPDTEFHPPLFFNSYFKVVTQNDKILISVYYDDGISEEHRIIRLKNDGTLDNTFNIITMPTTEIAIDNNSNIISNYYNSIDRIPTLEVIAVHKFLPNGEKISEYIPSLSAYAHFNKAALYNDFIILSGDFYKIGDVETSRVAKIDLTGEVDPNFSLSEIINNVPTEIKIIDEDQIYIAFNTKLLKINKNGEPDHDFNTPTVIIRPSGYGVSRFVEKFKFLSNGQIIVASSNGVFLLNEDGSQDQTYQFEVTEGPHSSAYDIDLQSTDKLLVGNAFQGVNNIAVNGFVRLNIDGSVDNTFNYQAGETQEHVDYINVTEGDRIVLTIAPERNTYVSDLYRLEPNGILDTEYHINIVATVPNSWTFTEAIDYKSQSIIVSYSNTEKLTPGLAKIDSLGKLDNSFKIPEEVDMSPSDGKYFLPVALHNKHILMLGEFNVNQSLTGGVLFLDNDTPQITDTALEITTQEEAPIEIALNDLIIMDTDNSFPDDFTLMVDEGSNYTLDDGTVIPDQDFNGTLTVPVYVNDGIDNSPTFELYITVTPVNDIPIITAQQNTLVTNQGEDIKIKLEDIIVEDVDNIYPDDFSLAIGSGIGYTVSDKSIRPDPDFSGTLTVPVKVNDGEADSELYNLSVEVSIIVGLNDKSYNETVSVYPNPVDSQLQIKTNQPLTSYQIIIYNAYGADFPLRFADSSVEKVIDVSNLSKGIYFLKVIDDSETHVYKFQKE